MSELSPLEWGATIDYDSWVDDPTPRERIAAHWNGPAVTGYMTGRDREIAYLRAVERYHLGKGWRGIAYGKAYGASGTVYRLRGWSRYAAHSGDYDTDGILENSETFPALFIMGESQTPTTAQLAAFEQDRRDLEQRANRELILIGHQEIAQQGWGTVTTCPGPDLMAYVKAHRRTGGPVLSGTPIMGVSPVTQSQALAWLETRNAHPRLIANLPTVYTIASQLGVRADVLLTLMCKETGFGHYRGVVPASHHNWGGIKVTAPVGNSDRDPTQHQVFADDITGIRAVAQHLHAYAVGQAPAPVVDPRHFPWIFGTAPNVEDLDGKWAGPGYGRSLAGADWLQSLIATPPPVDQPAAWAAAAWMWGQTNGILSGSSRPDATVTDQRMITFLHRFNDRFGDLD